MVPLLVIMDTLWFSCTKIERFGFGSGSMILNLIDSGSVGVHRKKAVLTGSPFGSTPCLFQTHYILKNKKNVTHRSTCLEIFINIF